MRAAAITGPGTVEVLDQPRPEAKGDLVVVKILATPMCTEFKQRKNGVLQSTLGHEAAGVVVEAGDSRRFAVGDRVAVMPHYGCGLCRVCKSGDYMHCAEQRDVLAETGQEYGTATYAQYVLKPDWLLVRIPDDVSLMHGAMACCGLGPSFGAAERMHLDALDTFVVSGCGPVGLGAVIHGAVRGARTFAIETSPYRAALAAKLGAEHVIDPTAEDVPTAIRALTDGRGADAAIETSGAPGAPRALALSMRARARMAIVAWTGDIVLPPLVPLGLELSGVWHWNSLALEDEMWATVRKAAPLLDQLITHVLPLEDVSAAMDLQDAGECGKIVLLPHGEFQDIAS
ncbi:MAG: L-iditol 2-dehydrogenase [Microbacteriaceae bacterium]|nr:L-iditol 2-dehydrogenase [Microbacteriaceae bacterium]